MHVSELRKAYIKGAFCGLQDMEICTVPLRVSILILNLSDNIFISVHNGQIVEEFELLAE